MSWYRIEGKLPQHRKWAPLSDAAWRLAQTAGCWCVENMTDGLIPKTVVPTLTAAPRGKRLGEAIEALLTAVIWEEKGDRYELHDHLLYNMSRTEHEAKIKSGALGGKAKAAKRLKTPLAGASGSLEQKAGKPLADSDSDSDKSITLGSKDLTGTRGAGDAQLKQANALASNAAQRLALPRSNEQSHEPRRILSVAHLDAELAKIPRQVSNG